MNNKENMGVSTLLSFCAFWGLGLIWGSNFIYMKMAAELISPLQIVFLRVLAGFLPVLLYALWRRELSLKHLRYWYHFLVMSLLATVVYYFGFAQGTSLLLSGLAGALSGAIPLFVFLFAVLFLPEERGSLLKIIGVVIGCLGVVLLAHPTQADLAAGNVAGVLSMVGGSLSVGASFVYAKKYIIPLKIPASALTTWQLGFGLLILLVISDYSGLSRLTESPHALWGLIVGLGLLGTGAAYIFYYYLLETLGAVRASSVTYIPPVVALAIGATLSEAIGIMDYLATGLIFLGVFLLKKK